MADHQQNIEQLWSEIERYLQDQMTSAERLAFRQSIEADPELQAEIDLHKAVHDTLGDTDGLRFREVLRQTANKWHAGNARRERRTLKPLWTVLSVAATILLLVVTYTWFGGDQGRDVFAENFEPYTMIFTERAAGDTAVSALLLSRAVSQYNTGDMQAAAVTFEELRTAGMNGLTIQFYQAVALLGSGQPDRAANLFAGLLEKDDHLLREQSRWYLGLALWQLGDRDEAMKIFQSINPGEYNYDRASGITPD